jgi:hypothetical protein
MRGASPPDQRLHGREEMVTISVSILDDGILS